jgi:hypothetical protein
MVPSSMNLGSSRCSRLPSSFWVRVSATYVIQITAGMAAPVLKGPVRSRGPVFRGEGLAKIYGTAAGPFA